MSKEQRRKGGSTVDKAGSTSSSDRASLVEIRDLVERVAELANIEKELTKNQIAYQEKTDGTLAKIKSRLDTVEVALGLKKATESLDEPKKDASDESTSVAPAKDTPKPVTQEATEGNFVLSDGPHVMWKYWDYKTNCWRGPKFKIGHALAAVGHDYNLVEEVCVWIKGGKIEKSMTPEEIETYLPH